MSAERKVKRSLRRARPDRPGHVGEVRTLLERIAARLAGALGAARLREERDRLNAEREAAERAGVDLVRAQPGADPAHVAEQRQPRVIGRRVGRWWLPGTREGDPEPPPPRHYIYATRNGPGDPFRQFADRARSEAGWTCHELDTSHNPHITCPNEFMALLTKIMAGGK